MKELDDYCKNILTLLTSEKELGFNKPANLASEIYEFSRPTLSLHLKHLVKKGLLSKRKDRASRTHVRPHSYYSLNMEALLEQIPQLDVVISEFKEIDDNLDRLPINRIAYRLVQVMCLLDMINVRLYLEYILQEEKKRSLFLSRSAMNAITQGIMIKLARACKGAKREDIEKAIEEIDTQIDKLLPHKPSKEEKEGRVPGHWPSAENTAR
jgi:predicted transcriptional regulator